MKHRFNKIFLDINGSRDVSAITRLISIYADGWEDSNASGAVDTIVVKNWRMANLLRSTRMTAELLGSAQCRSCGHCAAVDTEATETVGLEAGGVLHIGQQKIAEESPGTLTKFEGAATPLIAVVGLLMGFALGCVAGRKWR